MRAHRVPDGSAKPWSIWSNRFRLATAEATGWPLGRLDRRFEELEAADLQPDDLHHVLAREACNDAAGLAVPRDSPYLQRTRRAYEIAAKRAFSLVRRQERIDGLRAADLLQAADAAEEDGKDEECLESLRQAHESAAARYEDSGRAPALAVRLSSLRNRIGRWYRRCSDPPAAVEWFERDVQLMRDLVSDAPWPDNQRELSMSLRFLGNTLAGTGDLRRATRTLTEAVCLRRRLLARSSITLAMKELSGALNDLGVAWRAAGRSRTARRLFAVSLEILAGAASPGSLDDELELATRHINLASEAADGAEQASELRAAAALLRPWKKHRASVPQLDTLWRQLCEELPGGEPDEPCDLVLELAEETPAGSARGTCPACGAGYVFRADRLTGRLSFFRCRRCQSKVLVTKRKRA